MEAEGSKNILFGELKCKKKHVMLYCVFNFGIAHFYII